MDGLETFPSREENQKENSTERLQMMLDKVGFTDLKKNPEGFRYFLKETKKEDMHRYLSHINQELREASSLERGFYENS